MKRTLGHIFTFIGLLIFIPFLILALLAVAILLIGLIIIGGIVSLPLVFGLWLLHNSNDSKFKLNIDYIKNKHFDKKFKKMYNKKSKNTTQNNDFDDETIIIVNEEDQEITW